MKKEKSSSILRKFLLFNLSVFSVLGLFTLLYLKAIQPNLVKKRTINHSIIINNTSDHIQRLNITFDEKNIKRFLLSTRFLFQGLDRVQFYNNSGQIIGDTNILDLDRGVFSKTDSIIEESIDGSNFNNNKKFEKITVSKDFQNKDVIEKNVLESIQEEPLVIENKKKNNFL